MKLPVLTKTPGVLLLLIAISAVVHWHWLFVPGIFTANDFWYTSNQFFIESLSVPKILESTTNIGAGIATPTHTILLFFGGLLTQLGFGFELWERIFFLWPLALLSPIPIFFFLLRATKLHVAAFVGSLVYLFNIYIIAREVSHLHIAIVYFIAPLLFICFEKLVKTQSYKSILAMIVVVVPCAIFEIRILYICFLMLFAYGIYLLVTKQIHPSFKLLRTLLLVFIPLLIIQSYWLLPFIFTNSSLGYGMLVSRGLFTSFSHVQEASALLEPFWDGTTFTGFIPQPVPWWQYGIPLAACIWLAFGAEGRRRSILWFWALVALVGIFLVKQANPPFPDAYQWIFTHVPGFQLFRDASKFTLPIALSYAFLIASSLTLLWKKQKMLGLVVVILLLSIVSLNVESLISGKMNSMVTAYKIPNQFKNLEKILENDTSFGRTLWIPSEERFLFASQTHPRLGLANLMGADWSSYLEDRADQFSIISQPIFKSLLNMGSIAYIGEPSDAITDIYGLYRINRATFTSLIEKVPGLRPRVDSPHDILLWTNPDAKPLVYLADNVVAVHGSVQSFSGIDPSPKTAFIFETDILQDTFKHLVDTVVLNHEFIPFLPKSVVVQDGSVTTAQQIPPIPLLDTITRNDSPDVSAQLILQKTDELFTIVARTPQGDRVIGTTNNTKQDYVIRVNGKDFPYTYTEESSETLLGTVRLYPTKNTLVFYGKINGNSLIQDPSFETSTWGAVGDCNNSDSSSTDFNKIYAEQSPIGTDGSHSLSLSAGRHIACINTSIASVSVPALYIGSLDYQLTNGDPGYAKIVKNTPFETLTSITLPKTPTWQRVEFSFTTDGSFAPSLYIYQPGNESTLAPANSLIDNVQVYGYQTLESTTFDLPSDIQDTFTRKPYEPSDVTIQVPSLHPGTLLAYPLASKEAASSVGDCNNSDKTPLARNGIKATLTSLEHNPAISMEARRHMACITIPLSGFDSTYNYILSVTYKVEQGMPPRLTLYPNEESSRASVQLPPSPSTATYTTTMSGRGIADTASLIVYLPTDQGPAQSIISDLSITKVPLLPNRFIHTNTPPLSPLETSLRSVNPMTQILEVTDIGTNPRMLILSNRFDEGWKVFVRKKGSEHLSYIDRISWRKPGIEIAKDSHVRANGFVNGWIINPQEIETFFGSTTDIELVIEYWPQRYMDIGTLISGASLVLFLAIFGLSALYEQKHTQLPAQP